MDFKIFFIYFFSVPGDSTSKFVLESMLWDYKLLFLDSKLLFDSNLYWDSKFDSGICRFAEVSIGLSLKDFFLVRLSDAYLESLFYSTSGIGGFIECWECFFREDILLMFFSRFLKGSRISFLGIILFWTMCLATLFLIRFPKLLKALERIMEVAVAKFLYSSSFFFLVLSF